MSRRAESAGFVLPACVVVALSALFIASFPLVSHAARAHPGQATTAEPDPLGEASEAARAQGEPVEVAELTTETTQVVANPEGTFTLKESVVPERARRDGRWVDTDYGLVVGEDGAVRPRAAAVDVAFSGGSDRILATIERDGARLALEWSEALPVPAIEGDTATYEEIHPRGRSSGPCDAAWLRPRIRREDTGGCWVTGSGTNRSRVAHRECRCQLGQCWEHPGSRRRREHRVPCTGAEYVGLSRDTRGDGCSNDLIGTQGGAGQGHCRRWSLIPRT